MWVSNPSHAPHGACELKFVFLVFSFLLYPVTLPTERVSWNFVFFPLVHHYLVTLPTERVSWNAKAEGIINELLSHAPHGACELKLLIFPTATIFLRYAPHGACELKLCNFCFVAFRLSHAPHGACELQCYDRVVWLWLTHVTLPTERVSGDVGVPSYT